MPILSPRSYDPALAGEIRSLRRSIGLNQSQLAQLLGCTRPVVSDLERGAPASKRILASLRLLQWLIEAGEIPTLD